MHDNNLTRYDEALVVTDRVLSSRSEEGGSDGLMESLTLSMVDC